MRYDILLLDADGTLLDFEVAESGAFSSTMQRHGFARTPGDYDMYRAINKGLWEALERGETTQQRLKVERFARLFARLGYRADCEGFHRDYMDALSEGHALMPGALALCAALARRGRLYIATNGVAATQRRRLAACGLAEYITDVFISEELGAHKPDAAFFDALFARLGYPERERAVILGDSLSSDMQGGRNAGIATCWYNPQGLPCERPALCDGQITALEEFPAFLGLEQEVPGGLASSALLY